MRKKRKIPVVRWSIAIPMDVAGVVENHFFDQVHGKPSYGERQELIIQLLRVWIREQQALGQLRLSLTPITPASDPALEPAT